MWREWAIFDHKCLILHNFGETFVQEWERFHGSILFDMCATGLLFSKNGLIKPRIEFKLLSSGSLLLRLLSTVPSPASRGRVGYVFILGKASLEEVSFE